MKMFSKFMYIKINTLSQNICKDGAYIDLEVKKDVLIKRASSDTTNRQKKYNELLKERPRAFTTPISTNYEDSLHLNQDVEKDNVENEIKSCEKNISLLK